MSQGKRTLHRGTSEGTPWTHLQNGEIQPQHRIPVKQNFFVIACVCIAEPFSSLILLPFIYFMVKGFGYEESDIGSHAGIITSAFFIVQMVSTPIWCAISDRVGRKPCLIFGLFGTAVTMTLFGLSTSLAWAITTRAVCGLLNGNLAIARTMVGELAAATGIEKGRAFSLFGFCVGTGWMLGPFIGGSLANPAENLNYGGPGRVFVKYPWLLPCLFSAVYNLVVGVASIYFLTETVNLTVDSAETPPPEQDNNDERRPLLSGTARSPRGSPQAAVGSEVASINFRRVQILTLLSSIFYFIHIISFDELYALFAASSMSKGIGMSFRSPDIAKSLSAAGPAMIVALLLFPALHRRFSSVPLYMTSGAFFVVLYPLFSLLPLVGKSSGGRAALWVLLIILVILRYAAMVIGLASLQVLVNDIVKPRERAFMNGLAQSVGSLARAIGPSLGGFTWSWSLKSGLKAPLDFHATFLLLAILGVFQIITAIKIPPQKEIDKALRMWEREEYERVEQANVREQNGAL